MVPEDATTLKEVLATFAADGFDANMTVTEDALLRCPECRTESPADTVVVRGLRRLEGVSDPADMLAVAAVTCPSCGARGSAVLNYGPEADTGAALALRAFEAEDSRAEQPVTESSEDQGPADQSDRRRR